MHYSALRSFIAYREAHPGSNGSQSDLCRLLPNVHHLYWELQNGDDASFSCVPHLISGKLQCLDLHLDRRLTDTVVEGICTALDSLPYICAKLKTVFVYWQNYNRSHQNLLQKVWLLPVRRFRIGREEPVDRDQFQRFGNCPQLEDIEFCVSGGRLLDAEANRQWAEEFQNFLVTVPAHSMIRDLQTLLLQCLSLEGCGCVLDTVGSTSL